MADAISSLSRDLLAEILRRVDAATLAAASCAGPELRAVAGEEDLWRKACQATWPSTREEGARELIASGGGFAGFYGDAFPLIVYEAEETQLDGAEPRLSPSDIVSLVDVYYKKECVFSRVMYGVPEAAVAGDERNGWFSNCPFRVDVLQRSNCKSSGVGYDDEDEDVEAEEEGDDHETGAPPSVPLKGRGGGGMSRELERDVRLSWVVLDRQSGRAANLSSWRPMAVRPHWPAMGDVLMQFGGGECVISVRGRLMERENRMKWTEISMQVEDLEGVRAGGRRSMAAIQTSLGRRRRTTRWPEFVKGYEVYARERRERREKRMRSEGVVDRVFVFTGIALFAGLCHLIHSIVF